MRNSNLTLSIRFTLLLASVSQVSRLPAAKDVFNAFRFTELGDVKGGDHGTDRYTTATAEPLV